MRHIHITPAILSQTALLLTAIVLGAHLAGALPETYRRVGMRGSPLRGQRRGLAIEKAFGPTLRSRRS